MKGKAPIRRTLKYLEAGSLVLKQKIKIFCVNYNHHGNHHKGARYILFKFGVEYAVVYLI
jgi:small subunit ribosomal protein S25